MLSLLVVASVAVGTAGAASETTYPFRYRTLNGTEIITSSCGSDLDSLIGVACQGSGSIDISLTDATGLPVLATYNFLDGAGFPIEQGTVCGAKSGIQIPFDTRDIVIYFEYDYQDLNQLVTDVPQAATCAPATTGSGSITFHH